MNKKSSLERVKEFHTLFEHPIGEGPDHVEPLNIRQLRIKLLFEELTELAAAGDVRRTMYDLCDKFRMAAEEALYDGLEVHLKDLKDGDNVNKVEELDATEDIQYVLDGKKLTSGLWPISDKANELIHKANMCKAHISYEQVEETIKQRNDGDGYMVEERNGKLILLNSSGKIIKPHDHKKVDLSILFTPTQKLI